MGRHSLIYRNLSKFGIPLFLLGTLIFLMNSSLIEENKIVNLAITIDLLLTIPLVYFLLIRKSEISNITVIPAMLIGFLAGSFFMPIESQNYLSIFKTWALPLIEISILGFIIFKARKAIKNFKTENDTSSDFYNSLKKICYEILPKRLVPLLATEIAVLYYGFYNWKSRELKSNEFSYHEKSATPALLYGFILVIIAETLSIHFLLVQWSLLAAWILSALSIYAVIQLFGIAKSLSQRPISISAESLILKYGILNEAEIPFLNIEKIELSAKPIEKSKFTRTISPFGRIEDHNVIIRLKEENEMVGLYGLKKTFNLLCLHIDKPNEFIDAMRKAMYQYH